MARSRGHSSPSASRPISQRSGECAAGSAVRPADALDRCRSRAVPRTNGRRVAARADRPGVPDVARPTERAADGSIRMDPQAGRGASGSEFADRASSVARGARRAVSPASADAECGLATQLASRTAMGARAAVQLRSATTHSTAPCIDMNTVRSICPTRAHGSRPGPEPLQWIRGPSRDLLIRCYGRSHAGDRAACLSRYIVPWVGKFESGRRSLVAGRRSHVSQFACEPANVSRSCFPTIDL